VSMRGDPRRLGRRFERVPTSRIAPQSHRAGFFAGICEPQTCENALRLDVSHSPEQHDPPSEYSEDRSSELESALGDRQLGALPALRAEFAGLRDLSGVLSQG
jgi:hypothetical protein